MRDLQWSTQTGGGPKPGKTLQGIIANHHDRDLVTPAHENHSLSTQRGERVRVRGGIFTAKL
jgi:hypothetical protein